MQNLLVISVVLAENLRFEPAERDSGSSRVPIGTPTSSKRYRGRRDVCVRVCVCDRQRQRERDREES